MTLLDLALPVITFVALTAVGLDLTPDHFRRVRGRSGLLAVGVLAPVVLLPMLALVLLRLFQPESDVGSGLILVAACPIGGLSNAYSYLARASTALSVAMTTICSALAFVTIPLISWGFEQALGQSFPFRIPAMLLLQLIAMTLVPVLLGMWLRHRWPEAR